jgi:EmrB/QacA subfamily drug resistance transporter
MTADHTYERRWLALALLAAAQFVVVLDASIVNVALPSIGTDLGISQENLSWVVNAYVLVFGGFLLLGGRLADLLGRRRLFIVGLVVFGIASLLGGLSQNEEQLIAARALQGLGGALLSPAALSIVTQLFQDGAERNKALGVWGAVAGSGGAAGVLLGGVLTEYAGWEWVLFVNTPITIAVAAVASRLIPESRQSGERHYDVAGAVSVTLGLTLLVYAMVEAPDAGWISAQTLGIGAVALGLLAAFVTIESRTRAPLVPFAIFSNRTRTGANVVALLLAMSLFAMFFFVSLYMQQVLGYDALKAGLAYLPLAFGIIVSAGIASQLVTRLGFKPVLVTGMVLVAAGIAGFAQVSPDGTYVGDILWPSLLSAVGLGFAFVPVTIAAVTEVEPEEAGLASGLVNTAQQIGGAVGLAILATIATSRTDAVLAGAPNDAAVALTEGFQSAFWAGSGMALIGALLAATLISSRASRRHAAEARKGGAVAQPVLA